MTIDRRTPRVRCREKIEFHNSKTFVSSCLLDITAGGVFIETDAPLPMDAQCALRLNIPGDQATMNMPGHAVWIKQRANSMPTGMGVHCINLSPEQASKIQGFIEANQQSGRG
jgi:type IV pilus assembly protein PilZ